MAKLVAFYSRAGENYFGGQKRSVSVRNTEKAARMIAEWTGADLYQIEQKIPYSADYDTCIVQARQDLQANVRPELTAPLPPLDQYDKVYLCYPNYWGTMPMAVYTFLETGNFAGKVICPLCTHEGSGLSNTEDDIRKAAKDAHVEKGLALPGSSIDTARPQIEAWLAADYAKGTVYRLMDQGGPTDSREPYFQEASREMLRARTLCARANAMLPDDPDYVKPLEELFGRSLEGVRILTPFQCDFGNRVTFGKGVFLNHSAILSASGGIEFEDGVMAAPGLRIATINHDFNQRHSIYTYGKVTIKKNAWLGMNVTICPGVTIGEYAVVGAGAVVTKDVPAYAVVGGVPAKVIKYQDAAQQKE